MLWLNCPDVDLSDNEQAKAAFPWTGARWYVLGAVLYMLKTGCVTADNLVYGIRPSRKLNPKLLHEAFDTIHSVMDLAMEAHEKDEELVADLGALKTRAVLSTIGLWNNTERLAWNVVRSQYVEDCPGMLQTSPMVSGTSSTARTSATTGPCELSAKSPSTWNSFMWT